MTAGALVGAVEAGGTKVVCAVGSGPHDIRARAVIPTGAPAPTLEAVAGFFEAQEAAGHVPSALGLAWFGPLDLDPASPSAGRVTTTPKPGWAGTDVVGPLIDRLGVPVVLDTDVNGAAWGEHRWGAGRGLDSLVYVTVGTGVGGGAVIGGRRLHGLLHPEMGHLPVQRHPDDDLDGTCPYHGDCLEGLAAGPAILARTGRPAHELGDRHDAVVALEAFYLAQLVAAITYLLSPRRIVLGGGVPKLAGLREATREAAADRIAGAVDPALLPDRLAGYLVAPALGDDAGIVGAIAMAAGHLRA